MNAPREVDVIVVSHGFAAHYEAGFVNGLARNGLRVLLVGSDTTLAAQLHPGVALANLRGSQDPRRPRWRKALQLVRYHARLCALAWRRRGTPIVVIGLVEPEWIVGVAELSWLRLCSGRLALMVHNLLPHDREGAAMRLAYRWIYRIADTLLVHTGATRRALQESFGVAPRRVLLTPHGLNDAVPPSPLGRAEAKRALGLDPARPTVLFFGRTGPYKGGDLLLDALTTRPHLHLLAAGRAGADPGSRAFAERAAAAVAEGRAWWRNGFIADDEIGGIFAAADVAALPYRAIDQSGVLLLALTLGTPVLTTRTGGFADLVDARNGAFIEAPTAEAVGDALDRFFAQPQAIDPAAVRASVAHLSWQRTLEPLVAHLRPAAAGAPHPSRQEGTDVPH